MARIYHTPEPGAKFEAGVTYYTRSAGDHNCIFAVKIISRTEKTVVYEEKGAGPRRAKINLDDRGTEYIMPRRYSMAPTFHADYKAWEEFNRLAELECECFNAEADDPYDLHKHREAEEARIQLLNFARAVNFDNK